MAFSLKFRQLHPDPALGPLKHNHKLTLIFFSLSERDFTNPWIKRGDPTVIWPRDWLPKEEEGLGDNILVLSVECHVNPKPSVSVLLERILVRDLVTNKEWKLDRTQTIVLVGHGLGGLVIKSLTSELDKIPQSKRSDEETSQDATCRTFKENIKGIVFYSVPHTTSEEEFDNYCKSYTRMIQYLDEVQDFKHFNQHMVLLNVRFEKSIKQQRINLFDFVEGQKVMVPQSPTYKLVPNDVCEIEDADHFQVSQPLSQQHASYKRLLKFIQKVLAQTLMPYFLREAKQEVETSTSTNETEGVPNQQQKLDVMIKTNETEGVPNRQQKLDVMIRTIEDRHIKSPKDLQSLPIKKVLGKTSIACVGGKAMEADSVEFLFMNAGDMAKVVGIGLDWAKVVVTKEFGVNVVQEDEGIWTKLWCLEHFVPRIITIPNPKQKLMAHPNSAKTDGVELEANLGHVYVEDEKEENACACFPLVFELAEHVGLGRENAMKMKEVAGTESSGSARGEVNITKQSEGNNIAPGEKTNRNEDDERSRDLSGGLTNPWDPSPSSGKKDEENTVTVNVFPKVGELHVPLSGCPSPPMIFPILKFTFKRKGDFKTIDVEAITQCNFGKMQMEDIGNGLSVYQNNIKISLDCQDANAATLKKAHVEKLENVKRITVDTSTTIRQTTRQPVGKFQLVVPYIHLALNYMHTWTRGKNHTQGNTLETLFPQLDHFFVDPYLYPSQFLYHFHYPQEVLQDIALGASSKIKTATSFCPTIVSNWVNLNKNEESPYKFRVMRDIASKEHLKRSLESEGNPASTQREYEGSSNEMRQPNRSIITQSPFNIRLTINESEDPDIKQNYQVELRVNHAMTHMPLKPEVIDLHHSDTEPMIIEGFMQMLSSTSM